MKKIVITGILVILVLMFMGTCDAVLPVEEEVEYTDVVYAPNGNEVTLYLDGVGVPVTKSMRAINRELAMMAFDYFEVLFIGAAGGTTDIARTSWELGEPAGISNVPRGTLPNGIDYAYGAAKTTGVAIMFVGKKNGKTLLGVGSLTAARPASPGGATFINENTKSVTFSINALQAGLKRVSETLGDAPAVGVVEDSFKFVGGSSTKATRDSRMNLGGISYPVFQMDPDDGLTKTATYTFSFVQNRNYNAFIKVINTATAAPPANLVGEPLVQKRVPRYLDGGAYREPKDRWTTLTKVAFSTQTPAVYVADEGSFVPVIPITFTLQGTGIFSFYVEIPVYMFTKVAAGFNGGTNAEKWHIRSGVGSELYSLDDGVSNGGCVFLSVGESSSNWIEIEWNWVQ